MSPTQTRWLGASGVDPTTHSSNQFSGDAGAAGRGIVPGDPPTPNAHWSLGTRHHRGFPACSGPCVATEAGDGPQGSVGRGEGLGSCTHHQAESHTNKTPHVSFTDKNT